MLEKVTCIYFAANWNTSFKQIYASPKHKAISLFQTDKFEIELIILPLSTIVDCVGKEKDLKAEVAIPLLIDEGKKFW